MKVRVPTSEPVEGRAGRDCVRAGGVPGRAGGTTLVGETDGGSVLVEASGTEVDEDGLVGVEVVDVVVGSVVDVVVDVDVVVGSVVDVVVDVDVVVGSVVDVVVDVDVVVVGVVGGTSVQASSLCSTPFTVTAAVFRKPEPDSVPAMAQSSASVETVSGTVTATVTS